MNNSNNTSDQTKPVNQFRMRSIDKPYEIWISPFLGGTEYRILKKYKNNPRVAFMAVRSAATFGNFDYGDNSYYSVIGEAQKVYDEILNGPSTFPASYNAIQSYKNLISS